MWIHVSYSYIDSKNIFFLKKSMFGVMLSRVKMGQVQLDQHQMIFLNEIAWIMVHISHPPDDVCNLLNKLY